MLHLYQSNRLETLLKLLEGVLSVPLSQPLASECIIVQSRGMGRWLGFELARVQGISANFQFDLPASFVWQLMRRTLNPLPTRSSYQVNVLVWRVLTWLGQQASSHSRLQSYLANQDARRLFTLSEHIAEIFDQYLIYRPDWLAAWERGQLLGLGDDESWQAALWQDLTAEDPSHRANWLVQMLEHPQLVKYLPERVTLFGLSSLPPAYFDLFERLAEHIDICFFALNPSSEFWGDVGQAPLDCQDIILTGNPLLASMGRQGRAFFDRLSGHGLLHSLFAPIPRRHLLSHLQADVLELVARDEANNLPISADDHSLIVASCFSRQREVEALHDQILHWLAAEPDLSPADILVLCPDVEAYAPYVDAVFAPRANSQLAVPYAIADRGALATAPILNTILHLFLLPQSRFAADEILALLEEPALRRAFAIEEEELPQLVAWVQAAGMRWGRDAAHRAQLGLLPQELHTWRFGLDRLLLGLMLPADPPKLWLGASPLPELNWRDAKLVSRFVALLDVLLRVAEQLAAPRTAMQWQKDLNSALDQLLIPDADSLPALLQIRSTLETWVQCVAQSGYTGQVERSWLFSILQQSLSSPSGAGGFLSGTVTFSALMPMRSLPFRYIAVLGLNDGEFPRQHSSPGFDLVASHPRPGDRQRRLDDRYLFLETLLSAREGLYLSYCGRDPLDQSSRPPSVLLADLLDCVRRAFLPADAVTAPEDMIARRQWRIAQSQILMQRIVREHRLQVFHPDYFQVAAPLGQSFATSWLAALMDSGNEPTNLLSTRLVVECIPEEVSLRELTDCFSNSSRFFLQQRLGLNLPWQDMGPVTTEPFSLPSWGEESLRLAIADGASSEDVMAWGAASGLLPHGTPGQIQAAEEIAIGQQIKVALASVPEYIPLLPQSVVLNIKGVKLTAQLTRLTSQGQIYVLAAAPHPRTRLQAWLAHLVLCAAKVPISQQTYLVSPEGVELWPQTDQAEVLLAQWITAWREACVQPLPFFPKTTAAFTESMVNARSQGDTGKALSKAEQSWMGSEHSKGDIQDRWHSFLWGETSPLAEPWQAKFMEWAALWPTDAMVHQQNVETHDD